MKDLGKIKVGKRIEFSIGNIPNGKIISKVKRSCSCFNVMYGDTAIKIIYYPTAIPIHLKLQGYYDTEKFISVLYNDGSGSIFNFKARVIEK